MNVELATATSPSSSPSLLKRCSRCKMVWYCSVACQKRDFADHKLRCQYIKTLQTELDASEPRFEANEEGRPTAPFDNHRLLSWLNVAIRSFRDSLRHWVLTHDQVCMMSSLPTPLFSLLPKSSREAMSYIETRTSFVFGAMVHRQSSSNARCLDGDSRPSFGFVDPVAQCQRYIANEHPIFDAWPHTRRLRLLLLPSRTPNGLDRIRSKLHSFLRCTVAQFKWRNQR